MTLGQDRKTAKNLESIIGRHAMGFQPFSAKRSSEAISNAFIMTSLAQEGPCWPYRVIQLSLEHWERQEGRLKAIGLKEPTNLGIQKRLEALEREGFVRSLPPSEVAKISKRASKAYDLTKRGYAVAWLLNLVRSNDEIVLRLLKRTEGSNDEMPGQTLLIKLMERKKAPHLLRHAFTLGTIRLLGEFQEEEIEPELKPNDVAFIKEPQLEFRTNMLNLKEEDYPWWRHGQLIVDAALDIAKKAHLLSQTNQMRYLRYIRSIGPPEKIKDEIAELQKLVNEDPQVKSSLTIFKDQVLKWTERMGV